MPNKNPSNLKKTYKTLAEIEEEIKYQRNNSASGNGASKPKRSVFDDDFYYQNRRNYSISLNNKNELDPHLTKKYLDNSNNYKKLDGEFSFNSAKFEAVYNSKKKTFEMVLTNEKGKKIVLPGVTLNDDEVKKLSGKDVLNKDKVSRFSQFKQNLYKTNKAYKGLYDLSNFSLRKEKPKGENVYKSNNVLTKGLRRFSSGSRNFIRNGIHNSFIKPAQKFVQSLAKPLGSLTAKVGALLLKLLLNPFVGIPLLFILLFFLIVTSLKSPVYPPSDGRYVRDIDNPLMEHINDRYNKWSDVGLDLAEVYGVYFNLVDSFTLAAYNNPSILVENNDELKNKYPQWDQDYFARNTFLSMLGPLETRTEYYHWTWSDWEVGFTTRPTQYTQTRTYIVKERVWNPPVTTTKIYCVLKYFQDIQWEVSENSSCPNYAFESLVEATKEGYWEEFDVRYFDGRNLLESWWDTKNTNVAFITDGMVNTSYYTYTEPPLPIVEKPTCKDCNSELVINNGFITKTVDYWTVKDWDTIIQEYFDMRPDGSRFKTFFNITEAKDMDYGSVKSSFSKFSDSQKYVSSDSDYKIDYTNLHFEHYYFDDYALLTTGIEKMTLNEFKKGLDELRITFNESYGDDIILEGLVSSFVDPANYSAKLTSRFGVRFIDYKWEFHYAIDLAAPIGTPLIGVRDGGIVVLTYNECPTSGTGYGDSCGPDSQKGAGNVVIVKYPFMTLQGEKYDIFVEYAHIEKGSILVKSGDLVNKNQIIAKMGSSGSSTGPHLHFAVWAISEDGTKSYMNPSYLIKRSPN